MIVGIGEVERRGTDQARNSRSPDRVALTRYMYGKYNPLHHLRRLRRETPLQAMENEQWMTTVQQAFSDPELVQRISSAAALAPDRLPQLFEDISKHVLVLEKQITSQDAQPDSKKRKLVGTVQEALKEQHAAPRLGGNQFMLKRKWETRFECQDVSVQIPLRKKMKLKLQTDPVQPTHGDISVSSSTTDIWEYSLLGEMTDQVFCLPVPEKQARQMYFAAFPQKDSPTEPLLFVMNETSPHNSIVCGAPISMSETDTYVTLCEEALNLWLKPHGKKVIRPSAAEFASSIEQSHRKGEKAYHVKAHRGSKEGEQ